MPTAEFKISWAPAAERDLDEIYDYYAEHVSPEVAERLLRDITEAAERVIERPFSGSPRPELRAGLRRIRVAPYLLYYKVDANTVGFVRVLHERRDLVAAFEESES